MVVRLCIVGRNVLMENRLRDTVVMCECAEWGFCPREERDRQFFEYGI